MTIVYDRRHLAKFNKKAPLEIRVAYDYKQCFISTGIMLYPNQWKNGTVINCPDAMQLCQILNKQLMDIRQVILEMSSEGCIDIFSIVPRLRKKQEKLDFIGFCEQRASIRKYGKEKDTQERYERFLRLFRAWGGIREFEDITDKNIILYNEYLSSTGMKPYSKWNNYHRFLNSFITDAIDEGYLRRNPYKWVNIERCKESKGIEKCLTPEEFLRLKAADMPTESLERFRDLFVFQTYTCLSYSDLRSFDSRLISEIKGTKVYTGSREKTDKPYTIPLREPALAILKKYNGTLPVISNVKYNH